MLARGVDETSWTSLFYHDPEINKLICITVGSDKIVAKNVYTKEVADKAEFSDLAYFITADGKQSTAIEHIKWTDQDTFIGQLSDIFVEGKKQPDSPKVTYKRVK